MRRSMAKEVEVREGEREEAKEEARSHTQAPPRRGPVDGS